LEKNTKWYILSNLKGKQSCWNEEIRENQGIYSGKVCTRI